LDGKPRGKARAQIVSHGGKTWGYTPAPTRAYEKELRAVAKDAMGHIGLFGGPVELLITATFPVPKSWPIKKRNNALTGYLYPVTKPDFDNIEKMVADAIKGVVWRDDSQVVASRFRKVYGQTPTLQVIVAELESTLLPGLL
jgi:Holliday junction resolvase RusA-like endonuclease